ncbi:MAG: hypothetical protein U0235_28540 [Polyangiaceae bacterium]
MNAYVTDNYGGTVVKVPLLGGSATTIAAGLAGPSGIAIDATHVYWTEAGSGTIKRAPK